DSSFPAIEAHFSECEMCAGELRKQARLDLAIAEVVSSTDAAAASVGGYRIERLLWSEDQVRVYAARDSSGTQVMLKELSFRTTPSNQTIRAFNREADILHQLEHRSIPRCLTSFEASSDGDTRLYLVHEYIEGETLQARLAHHRFVET